LNSDRHAAWHPPHDFQQIGLHVNDLVVAVPFAGAEVLQEKLMDVRKLKARMFQREFPERDRMLRDVLLAERGLHDLLMEIDTLMSYRSPPYPLAEE
jgi:hypothetical protein